MAVGQSGLPGTLDIVNASNGAEATDNIRINDQSIMLILSCGTQMPPAFNSCGAAADPGVLVPSATGVGPAIATANMTSSPGNACAGITFTITLVDATQGLYVLEPSTPIILGPAGTAPLPSPQATCEIDFTYSVVKAPTKDSVPARPGLQTSQFATASGVDVGPNVPGVGGGGGGSNFTTVAPASLALTTQVAPASIALGSSFHDTATLAAAPAGSPNPTGTVTFNVYSPADPNCAAAPAFTSTNPLNAAGTTATSGTFTPTGAGTYRVTASYSGDPNYTAATSACTDATEATVVAKGSLPIVTSASAAAGGMISDVATLGPAPAGAAAPSGTVTFNVYGPADATCASAPVFSSTTPVNAAGTSATSTAFKVTSPGTYRFIAAYSGDTNYAPAASACNDANESVAIPAPVIALTKAAAPLSRVEPGGSFTFTAVVSNPSTLEPVKIVSLVDNVYGDLATRAGSTCGALIGTILAPGASSAPCTFTGPFTGVAGASQTDTITVTGVDSNGLTATATAQATVTLTPAPPVIALTKAAAPFSRVEPGGSFTFTAVVSNPSTLEPVKIVSLVDNVYGDLATRAGSTCGALIGTILAPGASSAPCTFTGPFTGVAGASQTDTITVTGTNNGTTVTATAQATVTLTPKGTPALSTNTVGPTAPDGAITDTATLTGGNSPTGTIVFTLFGPNDATCAGPGTASAPVPVSGDGSYTSAAFTPGHAGTYRFIAAYSGDANNNATAGTCNAPNESVVIPTPVIALTKAAAPSSLPEPGGTFTFTAQVSNPSATDPVKITSLADDKYGDLATRAGSTCGALIGTILAPGASSAPCSFTGPFTGKTGDSQTDTITVTGVDSNGLTATATAQATVTLTPAPPVIALTKAAAPFSRVEPGGSFTFTAVVSNPSTLEPVKIVSLVDNVYGDLATRAGSTCGALIGTILAPGASSAPCTFTGPFTGVAGDSQTDTITVTGTNNGTTVTATAQATVTLTPKPQIAVKKAVTPASLPAPGGSFTFTAVVSNPSSTAPVKITALVDDKYGDLATRAGSTCGGFIGLTLAPGASTAACSFPGAFSGNAGDSQTDTITVTGVGNGVTVTATSQATVTLTPAQVVAATPSIAVTKTPSPASRPAPGGLFAFAVVVTNTSAEQVTLTSLSDNVYGNLNGKGTCAIGAVLAPSGGKYSCSFSGSFNGAAGASQTDTVTPVATDAAGKTATATAQATVTLTPAAARRARTASRLTGPLGCVSGSYRVNVTGSDIRLVTFRLNGSVIGVRSSRDSHGRFSATVKVAGTAALHLTVTIQYTASSHRATRTLAKTFLICHTPRFTG